jgi:hypothetical protein
MKSSFEFRWGERCILVPACISALLCSNQPRNTVIQDQPHTHQEQRSPTEGITYARPLGATGYLAPLGATGYTGFTGYTGSGTTGPMGYTGPAGGTPGSPTGPTSP